MSDHRPRVKPGFYARSIRFGPLGVTVPAGSSELWNVRSAGTFDLDPGTYPIAPSFGGPPRIYEAFHPTYTGGFLFLECLGSTGTLRENILQEDVDRYEGFGGLCFGWDNYTFPSDGFWYWPKPVGEIYLSKRITKPAESTGGGVNLAGTEANGPAQGRYWTETWMDKWGPHTNTTTLHRYQFSRTVGLFPFGYRAMGYRWRMAWMDSDNGIKLLAMEAANRFILHGAINHWTRTREWETFPATGKESVLRAGEPATQHFIDNLSESGSTFPTWSAGELPAGPVKTFLDNFRAAYMANDTATVTTLAGQALDGTSGAGVGRQSMPYQSRYHLHRMRFLAPQPTYAAALARDTGISSNPTPPKNWQVHTQAFPQDRTVTYPNVVSQDLIELDFETPLLVENQGVRGIASAQGVHQDFISFEQEHGTTFPHPTVAVEAETWTRQKSHYQAKTYTRGTAPAMTADGLPATVRWIQEGSTRLIPNTANYENVTYRARLSNVLGTLGLTSGSVLQFNGAYIPGTTALVEGYVDAEKPVRADASYTFGAGNHYVPYTPYTPPYSLPVLNPFQRAPVFIWRNPQAVAGSPDLPRGLVYVFIDRSFGQTRFLVLIRQGWSGTFDFQYRVPGFMALSDPITVTITVP